VLWAIPGNSDLWVWFGVMTAVACLRLSFMNSVVHSGWCATLSSTKKLTIFCALAMLIAISWGVLPLVIQTAHTRSDLVLLMIAGIASGGAVMQSPVLPAALLFLGGLLLPPAVTLLLSDGITPQALAWICYWAFLSGLAASSHRVFRRNVKLRIEREQLVSNLELARQTAENSNNAKSQFLAHMSHEIRTPLNGIIGITDLLVEHAEPPAWDETLKSLRVIQKSGHSLLGLINDVLDFSKIEAGKIVLESRSFSPRALTEELLALTEPVARGRAVSLTASFSEALPRGVLGDESRVRQILQNLLSNAVKFTPEGGSVTVTCGLDKDRGIRFSVRDTGIGIAPEHKERIFESFTQADSSITRRFGGTGLGLAIVKRLVDLMRGEISVISQPERGTEFVVSLPLPQTAAPLIANELVETEQPSGERLRVLVAEDNVTNQFVVTKILERMGHEVVLAGDGAEALRRLSESRKGGARFDVILMDCQMPVLDGFKTTEEIRKLEVLDQRPSIPIIALTAHAMKEERERCAESGMNYFITKPIDKEELRCYLAKATQEPR
jgi:signal transduction histidine kinase/CheY-like chemotaxis protein